MSSVIPLDLLINLVRYHLYEAVAVEGLEVVRTEYLAGVIGNGVTASFVRLALNQLVELDEATFEAHPGQLVIIAEKRAACLTPMGTRMVEQELRDPDSLISRYRDFDMNGLEDQLVIARGIPASDRIVNRTDNQDLADQAVASLADLRDELSSQSNEIGEAFGDDREIAINEIEQLSSMVEKPRIRVNSILAYARRSLSWIAEKAGGASVGDLAKRALAIFIEWLT
ncbi:hypothetical protein [Qipengyuania sp. R86523]|uniref:hypothetical protein n=1 Tax=Qipengyuania sp. R86523 TaxID=3093862 RepID=UPI0037C6F69D